MCNFVPDAQGYIPGCLVMLLQNSRMEFGRQGSTYLRFAVYALRFTLLSSQA